VLDRTKLIRELQKVTDTLFRDFSHEYEIAQKTWHEIVADPIFAHKVAAVQAPWLLPSWRGKLDEDETPSKLGEPLKQSLHCPQSLLNTLRVVEAVDADAEQRVGRQP